MACLQGIVEDEVHVPESCMSAAAQDFILQCLRKDPLQRPCITDLLQHPWLKVGKQASTQIFPSADLPCALELVMLQLCVSLLEVMLFAHRNIQRRVGLRAANCPLQAADDKQPATSSAPTMCAAAACTSPVHPASQERRSDAAMNLFVRIPSPHN